MPILKSESYAAAPLPPAIVGSDQYQPLRHDKLYAQLTESSAKQFPHIDVLQVQKLRTRRGARMLADGELWHLPFLSDGMHGWDCHIDSSPHS